MKKFIRGLTLVLLVLILGSSNSIASDISRVKRVAGKSRVETSIDLSREAYGEAKNVVLVGYKGEVDALTASLFAELKEAPILFVDEKSVTSVKKRLVELKTEKVYVVGGEGVFSKKLFNYFGLYNPRRIQGRDRYKTAIELAKESVGNKVEEVFLARGDGLLADGLAIGPISARDKKPLFLTEKESLPKESLEALKSMEIKKVNIVGGRGAVSGTVEKQLKDLKIEVDRTSGETRELTALAISDKYNKDPDNIIIANGWNYPDATLAGYFAGKKNSILLFSGKNKISKDTLAYIEEKKKNIYLLGGVNAIEEGVIDKIISASRTALVSNSVELRNALLEISTEIIKPIKDISLESSLIIDRPIRIEGNNKKIIAPYIDPEAEYDMSMKDYHGIIITSDNVIINNLIVEKANYANIIFSGAKNCQLNKVTLQKAKSMGCQISSSEVRVKDIKTLENGGVGIVVSGSRPPNPDLDPKAIVSGKNIHKSPEGKLTAFIEIWGKFTNDGWVEAEGYKEFGEEGPEPSSFDDTYYFYLPEEYKKWMKEK